MIWKNSNWITYLEGYCKGQNQIQDEYVRKVANKLGIDELLDIRFRWQEEIRFQFQSQTEHKLIILTGTAGDGKTKLCRDIVKAIDGDAFDEKEWNSTSYSNTKHRTVVKDFSELKEEKHLIISELIKILGANKVTKPILIAVNDGILIEEIDNFIKATTSLEEQSIARRLKTIIEDKINLGFSKCTGEDLINLINLSKLNAKENMTLIFEGILNNSGWKACNGCVGKENRLCTIYNKYNLLKTESHIKDNFTNIILLLQLNNVHFTIRELLNLATNTLLANVPKAKSLRVTDINTYPQTTTLNCEKISKSETLLHELNSESTIEVGFLGMNLGIDKMHNNRPFSELNKLSIGEFSTNYWDVQLKYPEKRGVSIPLDSNKKSLNEKNITNSVTKNELWDAYMMRSRIQLYCYQNNDRNAYNLLKYTNFGDYIENIYLTLNNFEKVDDVRTISMIILSLNRVFHGRYISESSGSDRLYIPEKGLGSITPISVFHGDDIRSRDIFILTRKSELSLSGARIEPILSLEVDADKKVQISLTVELYQYLFNISKGSPPNTADPRLYKKLLILRSKLATLIRINRRTETYSLDAGDFKQIMLEVNNYD